MNGAPKVLLRAPLHPYTGYGNDGIGLAQALDGAGLDVYLDPTHCKPPLPPRVAALLSKRQEAPFDLLIHHVDPANLGITPETRRAARVAVAWTMWEYSSLDNLRGRSTLGRRLRDYDLVIGYDSVSTAALARYSPRTTTLQGGFWPQDWPAVARDWHGERFGFAMVGALSQRKDPFVAIQAFQELQTELGESFAGAELHLKTITPGLHSALQQWCPKLRVHYAVWPTALLREFYATQHVLLAPSRGEGKNVPALEFQATGGVVIATNWGGPTQWLSRQYAYPLDYTLVPESPGTPACRSARADKAHLKTLMRHVYEHRDEVAAKGGLASQVIPAMCSWQAVVGRLADQLAEALPGHSQGIAHTVRAAAQRERTLATVS